MIGRFRRWLVRESEGTGLPLGLLLIMAVAVHALVLWLAVNPFAPDEHVQILGFAWARLGLAPTETLNWEWDARIRSSIQPSMAALVLWALRGLGLHDPDIWIRVLRASTLVVSLGVLLRIVARYGPELSTEGRQVLWLATLLLWIFPLLLFRFTSENVGGILLAGALLVLTRPSTRRGDVVVGMLLGLSFLFRYQMAFSVLALLAWVVAFGGHAEKGDRPRSRWARVGSMGLASGAVVAAGLLLDRWFYGAWVPTPWNYLRVNLVEGGAAAFGTDPWYAYMVVWPLSMAPPLGLVVTALMLGGAWAGRRSPWVWCAAAFFIGHSAVAHKELRFLFPLLYVLPLLMAWGWEAWIVGRRAALRCTLAGILLIQNMFLLALLFTPLHHRGGQLLETHYYYALKRKVEEAGGAPVYVLHDGLDPYSRPSRAPTGRTGGLHEEVYREPLVVPVEYEAGAALPRQIPAQAGTGRILLVSRGPIPPEPPQGATLRGPLYEAVPGYRHLARRLGVEDAPLWAWLDEISGWSTPFWIPTLWEVLPARPEGGG